MPPVSYEVICFQMSQSLLDNSRCRCFAIIHYLPYKPRFDCSIKSYLGHLKYWFSVCPTARVTRWWAGRGNAILSGPASSHANCLTARRACALRSVPLRQSRRSPGGRVHAAQRPRGCSSRAGLCWAALLLGRYSASLSCRANHSLLIRKVLNVIIAKISASTSTVSHANQSPIRL